MAQFYYKNGSSWINALNLFYPTGAIYASTTSTSPGTLFGGTWQQISNAALRAATSSIASYTGSDTHTLTSNEIPSHSHSHAGVYCYRNSDGQGPYNWLATSSGTHIAYNTIGNTQATGGGSTFNRATLLQLLYVEENSLESRWPYEYLDV